MYYTELLQNKNNTNRYTVLSGNAESENLWYPWKATLVSLGVPAP
jgi:hypothetical protein